LWRILFFRVGYGFVDSRFDDGGRFPDSDNFRHSDHCDCLAFERRTQHRDSDRLCDSDRKRGGCWNFHRIRTAPRVSSFLPSLGRARSDLLDPQGASCRERATASLARHR
jgi:hypothetical protein